MQEHHGKWHRSLSSTQSAGLQSHSSTQATLRLRPNQSNRLTPLGLTSGSSNYHSLLVTPRQDSSMNGLLATSHRMKEQSSSPTTASAAQLSSTQPRSLIGVLKLTQKHRQLSSEQVSLLENRVRLLKQEQRNIKRSTVELRQKSIDIIEAKLRNAKRSEERQERVVQEEDRFEELREYLTQQRVSQEAQRHLRTQTAIQLREIAAGSLKREKQRMHISQQLMSMVDKQQHVEKVKTMNQVQLQVLLTQSLIKPKADKLIKSKMRSIEVEQAEIEENLRKLAQVESEEQECIRRIKKSQKRQQSAFLQFTQAHQVQIVPSTSTRQLRSESLPNQSQRRQPAAGAAAAPQSALRMHTITDTSDQQQEQQSITPSAQQQREITPAVREQIYVKTEQDTASTNAPQMVVVTENDVQAMKKKAQLKKRKKRSMCSIDQKSIPSIFSTAADEIGSPNRAHIRQLSRKGIASNKSQMRIITKPDMVFF